MLGAFQELTESYSIQKAAIAADVPIWQMRKSQAAWSRLTTPWGCAVVIQTQSV